MARESSGVRVEQVDYLADEWPVELPDQYDLIIGNPPFGGAIRGDTGRTDSERTYFRERFPLSARGAYDRCALFIERSMELLSDRGVLAFIVPRQVLASPSAAKLREALAERGPVSVLQVDDPHLFSDADVHVCGIVIGPMSRGVSQQATVYHLQDGEVLTRTEPFPEGMTSWSPLLDGTARLVALAQQFPALSSFLRVSASATTGEAYDWKPNVFDAQLQEHENSGASGQDFKKLVVSGSIDPFANLWGDRTTRYLGDRYEEPVVPTHILSERRREQADNRKVLLPGLSRVLEATPDLSGDVVGAVATMTLRFDEGLEELENIHFLRLASVLNSAWCRLQYRALHAASALSGGNIAVSRSKLEQLALLPEWRGWLTAPAQGEGGYRTKPADRVLHTVDEVLNAFEIEDVYKAVPAIDEFFEMTQRALRLAKTEKVEAIRAALDFCVQKSPKHYLRIGAIDLLLLSIAPKSVELIASEAADVE
jgi:hypothetical protein